MPLIPQEAPWLLPCHLKSMPLVISQCSLDFHYILNTLFFFIVEENEERSMVEPRSMEDIKLKALIAVLVDWINDELAEHRMIVQNVDEDLYDGQVLQKLLGNCPNRLKQYVYIILFF